MPACDSKALKQFIHLEFAAKAKRREGQETPDSPPGDRDRPGHPSQQVFRCPSISPPMFGIVTSFIAFALWISWGEPLPSPLPGKAWVNGSGEEV